MNVFTFFRERIIAELEGLMAAGQLASGLDLARVSVEPPREASHGDISTNAAMVLAKPAAMNPRALAGLLAPRLAALPDRALIHVTG